MSDATSGLILVLNAGSSSVKFALIEIGLDRIERELARGSVDGIGQRPRWTARRSDGTPAESVAWPDDGKFTHQNAIRHILDWIEQHYGLKALKAAGHRVVHGGPDFTAPVRLDAGSIAALRALTPLAPLHQPHNLAAIDSVAALAPDLPQIACFDTAFHATMPTRARNFALPRDITARGVRRYGFHGLSYSYIATELMRIEPVIAKGKVVVAHLGNGSSLCALDQGHSVATTMGFSALDGLMMGTRSGSIDPAVIFYLMRDMGMSAGEVETLLYQKSGLLGVSGISSDMRALRSASIDRQEAREAIELFTYRVLREIGSLIAALGGIDGLVFTAGIGENDTQLRADIIKGLAFTGFMLDAEANDKALPKISAAEGPKALVIPTNEEVMIARQTMAIVAMPHD